MTEYRCTPAPTLEQYRALIVVKFCNWHNEPVALSPTIDAYPHPNGWPVSGEVSERVWLSVQCPKCKYDWSLEKLGVPRP